MNATDAWASWQRRAEDDARKRLEFAKGRPRKARPAKEWVKDLRKHLNQLSGIGILQPHEQMRLIELGRDHLPKAERKRLDCAGILRQIALIGIGQPSGHADPVPLRDRVLALSPGNKLIDGTLRIMALVDMETRTVAGMSIQIQGTDRAAGKSVFGRYDLDIVPLGSSQVTHFDAHFHFGEDPADEGTPRWPTLFLDPEEAIDILVHTWFPDGPEDEQPSE